jgi:predicted TPR repeat methyltransferase
LTVRAAARRVAALAVQVRFPAAKALFDQLAGRDFSRLAREHGYGAVHEWVREQSARFRGRSIALLDVGCADGAIASVFSEQGVAGRFVGVDFSQAMLDACRQKDLYAELVQADLNYGLVPAVKGRFDVITACGVLEFVEDACGLLAELHGMLVRDGELLVTFELPVPGAPPEPTASAWKFGRSADEARALLEAAAFRVLSLEQRVAYQAVTSEHSDLRSLGIDVEYVFARAVRS